MLNRACLNVKSWHHPIHDNCTSHCSVLQLIRSRQSKISSNLSFQISFPLFFSLLCLLCLFASLILDTNHHLSIYCQHQHFSTGSPLTACLPARLLPLQLPLWLLLPHSRLLLGSILVLLLLPPALCQPPQAAPPHVAEPEQERNPPLNHLLPQRELDSPPA